jgi:hypothetical protein
MRVLAVVLLCASTVVAQHWQKQESHTDASLRGVKAVSDKVCWASGTGGTVLRTTDGGQHWQVIHVTGAEKLDFRDIEAPNNDANTAVVMSAGPAEQGQAKIFKTTDGGAHWKETFSTDRKGVFLDSIAFWDSKHGIGLSDPVDGRFVLIETEDGGASWRFVMPRFMPDALPGEGAFAASGTAIVYDRAAPVFITGGSSSARIFYQQGASWYAEAIPWPMSAPSAGLFGQSYRPDMHGGGADGIAVGGDYSQPRSRGHYVFIKKFEHGWKAVEADVPYLSGVSELSVGANAIAVGTAGCVEIVFGRSSVSVRDAQCTVPLNAISGPRGRGRVWAVGPKGAILRGKVSTYNSGKLE